MGCFLGCFGFSSKRRPRKPATRDQQKLGIYEPLDYASTNLDISGDPINSDSQLSKKPKEPLNYKIRKKVSFNLNVQTYEPIPREDDENNFWESDEEEKQEECCKESAKESQSSSLSDGNSTATKMASHPSNYRYHNCIDSYDEEDEIAFEESDLDDDEDIDYGDQEEYDYNDGSNIDDLRTSQEEFSEQFKSLSVSSQLADGKTKDLKPLGDSNEEGLKFIGMNRNARDRSQYVHPVLNPVENLSQWKAVKARRMAPVKRQRKENAAVEQQPQKSCGSRPDFSQSRPLMQEIAVDASLSNWLVSPDSYESKTASMTNTSAIAVETLPSKKRLLDSTCSWTHREDMPIFYITNLGA